jgi:hypothetical protein
VIPSVVPAIFQAPLAPLAQIATAMPARSRFARVSTRRWKCARWRASRAAGSAMPVDV